MDLTPVYRRAGLGLHLDRFWGNELQRMKQGRHKILTFREHVPQILNYSTNWDTSCIA